MSGEIDTSGLVERPKLNPSFVPVRISADEYHFRAGPWGGPAVTLRDEDGDGIVGTVVDQLDGTVTTAEILSSVPPRQRSDARDVIQYLQRRRLVYDATDGKGTERPSRPRPLTDLELTNIGERSVAVIGTEEMLSMVVDDLRRTNLAAVTAVPVDETEPRESTHDRVTWVPGAGMESIFEDTSLVIVCASEPRPSLFTIANRAAHSHETACLTARTYGYDGLVGPLVVPGESSCYRCYRDRRDATVPAPSGYESFEQTDETTGPSIRAFDRTVAGVATVDALNYLAYGFGFTVGRIVRFDFAKFGFQANDVLPMPRCSVCGTGKRVDSARRLSLEEFLDDGGDEY